MKRLLQYFKPYMKESILAPALKLLEALLELTIPMIVASIIDKAVVVKDTKLLLGYILLMLGVGLLNFGVATLGQYYAAVSSVGISKLVTKDLFKKATHLSKWDQDRVTRASLINRLTSDVQQFQTGLNRFFRLILRSPFIVLGSIIMASRISTRYTGIFLVMTLITATIAILISRFSGPKYNKIQKHQDRLVSLASEQLEGVRVTRAFNQEEREVHEFKQVNAGLKDKQLETNRLTSLNYPLTSIVVNIAVILVLWQGGLNINTGTLSKGQLVALVNYLLQILVELLKLVMMVDIGNKAYISAKRIADVLEEDDEPTSYKQVEVDSPNSIIEIKDGSFTYPSSKKPALQGLNITIEAGDFIGIIGGTGSGKSTLSSLLTLTYDITKGTLAYNSNYIDTSTRQAVRRSISVVPQKAQLLKGTIRTNLQLAKEDATQEEMIQALKLAEAWDFVKREERGLDARVEAFGRNFSGGQRQRLTIARAFLKKADILILDDSFSALDYITEARIQENIMRLEERPTIIMISQRTHSIQKADKILVLDGGRQIGLGSHKELIETCQVYQEIHESQEIKGVE